MAILLQSLCVRLGVATGRDLAQACRDYFSPRVNFVLWVLCEIAIAACDLAELLGSAIALQLLFGLPLAWGVCIMALDVIVLLLLQQRGFRYIRPPAKVKNKEFLRLNASILLSVPCSLFPVP
jgi:manganese transport protein